MSRMDKESLAKNIDGMINVLQLMKKSIQEGDYSEASSYVDGMVNDSEELREILEELQ